MISQKSQLEIKVKENIHTYQCPPNCPLNECLEALSILKSYVFGRIKELEEVSNPKETKEEEPCQSQE